MIRAYNISNNQEQQIDSKLMMTTLKNQLSKNSHLLPLTRPTMPLAVSHMIPHLIKRLRAEVQVGFHGIQQATSSRRSLLQLSHQ